MANARLHCPSCLEQKALRKSHFRWLDILYIPLRRYPYRCLICNKRFYDSKAPTPSSHAKTV
jgi:hypothetical protein